MMHYYHNYSFSGSYHILVYLVLNYYLDVNDETDTAVFEHEQESHK